MAALTIMGPPAGSVTPILTPLLYTADVWGDEWTLQTRAVMTRVIVQVCSHGMSQLEFTIPYGRVLSPPEGVAFADVDPQDLQGSWVRLDFVDPEGAVQVAFLGQVRGEERQVMGTSSDRPKGMQHFTAFGGEQLLALCSISHSFWQAPPSSGGGGTSSTGGVVELEWSPDFNVRDKLGFLTGNRSSSKLGGGYVFGGTSLWTRIDALNYVLDNFIADLVGQDGVGPTWSLGGQLDALNLPVEDVPIGLTVTADELLRKLLPREAGLDYCVIPTLDDDGAPKGYEITVFSLFGSDVVFSGASLSGNKSLVSLDANEADLEKVLVTVDTAHTVSRVRVLGARIVMCATLQGANGPDASGTTSARTGVGALLPLWTADQETAYKLAVGSAIAEENDNARDATKDVYQKFGPASSWTPPPGWLPIFDAKGEHVDGVALYQNKVREFLDWIPLVGEDGHPQRPLVIARDRRSEIATSTLLLGIIAPIPPKKLWAPLHKLHVGVSVLPNLYGLELTTRPPHKLARGMFDPSAGGTSASAFDPSDDYEPDAIDPTTLAATVAWRMDQRLSLEASLSGADDDGTVFEVPAHHPERSELWVVAAGTITDVVNGVPTVAADAIGSLVVVRNDSERLASFMAGVVARFLSGRHRAAITYRGWKPRTALLGQILKTIEQGGQSHGVNAPITSVELEGGMNNSSPRTIVRAGFAT